ncbi:hypothetical protein WME99_27940 [Sorangium sp. So ce136]|uniref:hypothetical protein n=1 Tax=Sorangium sp. So ce136 TaxID=3133284 RepID=UPI003EFCF748
MKPERIKENFAALVSEGRAVLGTKETDEYDDPQVDEQANRKWITSVLAMLRSVFGETSAHYTIAKELPSNRAAWNYGLANEMFGVLRSAVDAWERVRI